MVTVRPAVYDDIPALVKLWREMWDFHARVDKRFAATVIAEEMMAKWLEEELHNERALVLVALDESAVVGYTHGYIVEQPPMLTPQFYGVVSELAVTEKARGQDVGSQLLQRIHDWFRERNIAYVETNVAVTNPQAREFWRKNGYAEFIERLRYDFHGTRT